jgi:hypothetical protein
MNFPQGERHNACWFPDELEGCLKKDYGFEKITNLPFLSKSGSRWFNLIADATRNGGWRISEEDSLSAVRMGSRSSHGIKRS